MKMSGALSMAFSENRVVSINITNIITGMTVSSLVTKPPNCVFSCLFI